MEIIRAIDFSVTSEKEDDYDREQRKLIASSVSQNYFIGIPNIPHSLQCLCHCPEEACPLLYSIIFSSYFIHIMWSF
ncbi:hypothetical protein TNIN_34531 [Trichonephila inaurata madagascariensis]|uniref:Uncharacterized protein n=1 Tax=Trichonephila inaurata madagascariensis TaxID=2747483 RepID=A0A8X7CRC6_9ARAC|nr:hypothetical protein TNIN_34531 [Trichonephila inaurata madagascariensis]